MKKQQKEFMLMNMITRVLGDSLGDIGKFLESKLIFKVNISETTYRVEKGLEKYFKNIPDILMWSADADVEFRKDLSCFSTSAEYNSIILWGGYPIGLSSTKNDNSEHARMSIYLYTLATAPAKKNMERFLRACIKIQRKYEIERVSNVTSYFATSKRGDLRQFDLTPFTKRTFQNTFIPTAQEELIKESLDKFKSKREWYKKNSLPYHFGILLYSEPGTGKSTIAQAIADYMNAELIVFPGDAISEFPACIGAEICRDTCDPKAYRVICIEDVDCGFSEDKMTNYNVNGETKRKVGLAEILNCIDGLNAPSNTVYVLTTNHIEKLDPALIRPGRMDLKIHIPPVNAETFTKFCKYHYGPDCVDIISKSMDWEFDRDFTFAELQTDVMKGLTIDELIYKMKGEK